MTIRQLDPQVASKIAAGEVVERPVSVVKELVENSIDAGATVISVELRDGGFELIRVVDNGCGIPRDELATAFLHHATSKIRDLHDLCAIRTLGFRGEALYSIAAVSQVMMVSRTAGEPAGAFVETSDGEVKASGTRGSPPGTTVSVQTLFYNVPARRKFLKSAEIEGGRVIVLLSHLAFAYPAIQFNLVIGGRQVFRSDGSGDLPGVLVKVLGLETARSMIPLAPARDADSTEPSSGVQVSGFVSQPQVNRPNRLHMSFFINRRWVQSPMLARAVEQAYHTLLPVGRHPIAVIDLRLPATDVDVNVHPAKSEVKLLREGEVFVEVQRAVRAALRAHAAVPVFASSAGLGGTNGAAAAMPMHGIFRPHDGPSPAESRAAVALYAPAVPILAGPDTTLPPLRILGQVAQTYIIAEGPDGMFLIDQHTAHERILYERLMSEHARMSVRSQMLLEPLTLDLTPRQVAMLQPRLGALQEMGFSIESFGERSFLIRAIPAVLQGADAIQAVLEIVDLLADEKGAPANWNEALYITLACHGAVRAGKALSPEEMRQLIVQLEQTSLPRTCPHGRPTLLHISQNQLEREFGRR